MNARSRTSLRSLSYHEFQALRQFIQSESTLDLKVSEFISRSSPLFYYAANGTIVLDKRAIRSAFPQRGARKKGIS